MFTTLGDLVSTADDAALDAALVALVQPVVATAREEGGELISVEFERTLEWSPLSGWHVHAEWDRCDVCFECDHSQKRDCPECGIDAAPHLWSPNEIEAWREELPERQGWIVPRP